jgi:hypothetical protein
MAISLDRKFFGRYHTSNDSKRQIEFALFVTTFTHDGGLRMNKKPLQDSQVTPYCLVGGAGAITFEARAKDGRLDAALCHGVLVARRRYVFDYAFDARLYYNMVEYPMMIKSVLLLWTGLE